MTVSVIILWVLVALSRSTWVMVTPLSRLLVGISALLLNL